MKTGHNPGVQRGAAGPDSPGAAMLDRYPAMLPLLSTQQPSMSHPRLGASAAAPALAPCARGQGAGGPIAGGE